MNVELPELGIRGSGNQLSDSIPAVVAELLRMQDMIEDRCSSYLAAVAKDYDSISTLRNSDGNIVGGKLWTNYGCSFTYCVTETHLYTIHGDAVVSSRLFSDNTQEVLMSFFAQE